MPPRPTGPAYRIQTPRLVLRCWEPSDAPALARAIEESADHLRPWMVWLEDEPMPLEERVALLRRFRARFDLDEDFAYGIFDANEERVIGGAGLHTRMGPGAREIGYWIHADFIRQGLCTEAAAALTRVAFEVDGVDRVHVTCPPEHRASASIPRKLGFRHEATLRRRLRAPGDRLLDQMVWTLLDDEYPRSPAASARLTAFDAAGERIL